MKESGKSRVSPYANLDLLVLWILFGIAGLHRTYVGKRISGVAMLLTGGGFVIGWLLDGTLIVSRRFRDKRGAHIRDWCVSYATSSSRSKLLALLLCLSFGIFGVHRFYLNRPATGVLMLLTLGGFGAWWLLDLLHLATNTLRDGDNLPVNDWKSGAPFRTALVAGLIIGAFLLFWFRALTPVLLELKEEVRPTVIDIERALSYWRKELERRKLLPQFFQSERTLKKPIYQYKDDQGRIRYVDDPQKIPKKYRELKSKEE